MAVAPVFVVTGGAAGIGAAVAEEAVRRGYRVAIADHDGAALERKAAELKSISNEAKVLAYVMDVTSVEQNFAFRDAVLKTYGRADVVHLNAGIFTKDARMLGSWTKEGMSDADRKAGLQKNHAAWKKVYDVNFFGVVHGTQVWISTLLAQRQREPDGIAPTLVCTASTMGLVIAGPLSGSNAGYQSGKAGLIACYEALQVELLKRGEVPGESVNVACLCPGGVATAITAAMPATDPTLVSAADAAASLHSWLLLPPANRPFLIDTHNDFVRSAFGVRAAYIEGQLQPADVAADQIGEVFMAEAQRRQTAKAKL